MNSGLNCTLILTLAYRPVSALLRLPWTLPKLLTIMTLFRRRLNGSPKTALTMWIRSSYETPFAPFQDNAKNAGRGRAPRNSLYWGSELE